MNKNIILTNWHFWHIRKRSPLMLHLFFHGAAHDKKYNYISVNGSALDHIITQQQELEHMRNIIWEKLKDNQNLILNFTAKVYHEHKKLQTYLKTITKKQYQTLNNKTLADEYMQIINSIHNVFGKTVYLPLCIEPLLEQETKTILETQQKQNAEAIFNLIMTPVKQGISAQERISLLKMGRTKDQHKDYDQQLDQHLELFCFLKEKGMFMNFHNKEYYLQQLQQIKNPEQELEQTKEEQKKRKQLFEQTIKPFTLSQQTIFKTANESVYFRSWRTEHTEQTAYYLQNMFEEIATRLQLKNKAEVLWLLPDEITALLTTNKKANKTRIEERKQAFVYLTQKNNNDIILEGKEAKEFFKKLNIQNILPQESNDIKGLPAYPGKITGTAIVIHNKEEYKNIKKGEILVIHATSPDIIPYLTHIKAIITEEGGILSHAAVISREMKIPAIIGTGNCTKLIKTGEMIKVDTEQRTVKIVKEFSKSKRT